MFIFVRIVFISLFCISAAIYYASPTLGGFKNAVSTDHLDTESRGSNHKNSKDINNHIKIISDDLIIDDKSLSADFKGSVTVIFEDMILKTDNLKIRYVDNKGKKSVDMIEIPGKLKAIKTTCQELVVADRGEYSVSLNQLVLYGNVRMQRDNNVLITDKMVYVTKLKSMSNSTAKR